MDSVQCLTHTETEKQKLNTKVNPNKLTFWQFVGVDFSFILWHTHIQVCQIPLTKLQEPQVLTRSKTATLFELDCILHRAAKLTDRNFTIFPPSDSDGNLLVDETIEYYKKEIIKTINQIKTESQNDL